MQIGHCSIAKLRKIKGRIVTETARADFSDGLCASLLYLI
ncbi:hypothetical protein HMPREF9120_02111 [Neisseria sp. oral taxon 020 str. F0370]|nr:hypothetical protein HMPREF9120_02111 [Neisseria sp. oral taxon 020 str. F0370]